MGDDRGQMLLLSTLMVCACLIALAVCLCSIRASIAVEGPTLSREVLDNVIWVQDAGLRQAASEAGGCSWGQRAGLATVFDSRAGLILSDIEEKMLVRGIACSFTLNESLAAAYLEDNHLPDVESTGGILVKREASSASVCGCAYDLLLADGSSAYRISTIKIWA